MSVWNKDHFRPGQHEGVPGQEEPSPEKGAWKSELQTIVNNPYDFDSATGGLALCFTDVIIFNGHTI